jgi:hypothetical protein
MAETETVPTPGSHHPGLRELLRERERRAEVQRARARRCLALGTPTDAEIARMVADYRARGGAVTACAPRHVLPVHNGAGRDAQRWIA